MQLNPYLWKLYRESDQGKRRIETWSKLRDLFDDEDQSEIAELVNAGLQCLTRPSELCLSQASIRYIFDGSVIFVLPELLVLEKKEHFDIADVYEHLVDSRLPHTMDNGQTGYALPAQLNRDSVEFVHEISALLAKLFPDDYFPYLFAQSFYVFYEVAQAYEIPLPPIPKKRQYRERLLYYVALNNALQEFGKQNGLSYAELWAFIYDYGPNSLDLKPMATLPQATGIACENQTEYTAYSYTFSRAGLYCRTR